MSPTVDLKLRVLRDDDVAMGPGKADLLDAIAQTGSISAAARMMNMSYRRAWLLVDAMNRCFREPLVGTAAGGQKGGGAYVTPAGTAILERYRTMQLASFEAIQSDLKAVEKLLDLRQD